VLFGKYKSKDLKENSGNVAPFTFFLVYISFCFSCPFFFCSSALPGMLREKNIHPKKQTLVPAVFHVPQPNKTVGIFYDIG